ncbi:MAG: alpha/beta hydrolase [Huintestinicola sp.]
MKYPVSDKEIIISAEGKSIYGRFFGPADLEGNKKLVILSHGYNSSHSHMLDLTYALAKNGIYAYAYDFCGGSTLSKSSGSSLDMSIGSECDDLKTVIDHMKSMGFDDICLYGESQGGFISALTAAAMGDDIKGLFMLYPAFCIPDDWKRRAEAGMPAKMDVMGMMLSPKFVEGIPEEDIFNCVSRYRGRVLLVHGDSDCLVNVDYARRAAAEYENIRYEEVSGEGHGFSPDGRKKLVSFILDELTQSSQ